MRTPVAVLALLLSLAACSGSQPGTTPVPAGKQTVWPDEGPRTWAPRPTEPAITANDMRTRLYQLADDSMMGREAGTLGNFKGTEYIAREFKRLGLQPAGENGTYFQDLPFGPTGFDIAQSRLLVSGAALTPSTEWIPTTPSALNGLAAKFAGENIQTVFGGRWGDTATVLDPAMFRGKVVVFSPAIAAAPVAGARGTPAVRDLRAQSAGAAAVLVASLDGMNKTLVSNAFVGRIALKPATAPGSAATTAGATVTLAAATRIFGKSLDQLTLGAAGQPVSGAWSYEWRMAKYPGRNVIAVLPGTDPTLRGTYVLIGAHNDHNGMNAAAPDHDSLRAYNRVIRPQGANDAARTPTAAEQHLIDSMIARARSIRPIRRDSVNNGADDDGSGTAVLLEVAERFATQPAPRRTMLFISHVGEEKGLLGSFWFVDHPTVPLDSIVAAHNMDMLGKGRVTDVRFGGANSVQMLGSRRLSSQFGDLVDSVNAVRSEPMVIDYSWDRTNALNRFCRSDQVAYFGKSIPVTYFSLGYAVDYHQPTDEPQYIDYDHGARLGRFVHDIAETIANRPTRLAVLPPDQRDMSAKCGR